MMASHDAKTLAGKVALVTGAGRGLGRAFAEKLAAIGADVAIHGMRENGPAEYGEGTTLTAVAQEVGKAYGVRTRRVLGDLTKGDDIARVIAESEKRARADRHPRAQCRRRHRGSRRQAQPERRRQHQGGRRARGARSQPALDHPDLPGGGARHDGAHGAAASSPSARSPPSRAAPTASIYAVAKAGMTHYTRCLADQLRPYDIAVNCIAPGDTRTGRFLGTRAVDQDRMVETGTLDRIATVDEVARVVEFFAGPLGAFVSGQVLRVDGGGQCWPG